MAKTERLVMAAADKKTTGSGAQSGHLRSAEPISEGLAPLGNKGAGHKSVGVILFGCGPDLYRSARRHFPKRFKCSSESSFSQLLRKLDREPNKQVIILGPEQTDESIPQLTVLRLLKDLNRNLRIIYITDSEYTHSTELKKAGTDEIISQGRAKPKALSDRIAAVLSLYKDAPQPTHQPVFCEMREGKLTKVEQVSASERIVKTMEEFSGNFELHQSLNGHYAIINAILTVYYRHHMGTGIIDFGCGTAHPMRQFIEEIMVPEFAAVPSQRGPTRILALDNTREMIMQAREAYDNLFTQYPNRLSQLEVRFLLADLLKVDRDALSNMGFERPDTLLASYIAHWVVDKEASVKKMSELLPVGGKLISIEEWPPVVVPGPHMTLEQAERIRKSIIPIDRQDYYALLRKHGFKDVNGGVVVLKIDEHHDMYGNVFKKVREG